MTPVDPTEITDTLIDPAEDEMRALGTATADLGDRFAGVTVLETGNVGKTEVSHDTLRRLIPRSGAAIDRRDLTDRTEIVERMARDILAARREGRYGPLIDLTEYGWTPAQAMRWGTAAHAAASDPRTATQDVVDRLAASEAGPALFPGSRVSVAEVVAAAEAAVADALAEPDDFGGTAA